MKRTALYVLITVFAILATALAGCAAPSTSTQTGSIEVRVTDAPPNQDVTSVMVNVTSVEIHKAGGNQQDESGWLPMKLSGVSGIVTGIISLVSASL
jgi:hypothetical protein